MSPDRTLHWDGCSNVRDLGGLATIDGRTTRWGAVVRADSPAKLTRAGWAALYDYGTRTIVSLRSTGLDDEEHVDPPTGVTRIVVEIEDVTDQDFVDRWVNTFLWGTPLYYRDAIVRWPERHAAAVTAVARAEPGGVLVHCGRGCDRTGIVSMLLLALVRVDANAIAVDWELSVAMQSARDQELLAMLLEREGATPDAVIVETLESLDVEQCLRAGGLTDDDVAVLRARLLD